MASLGSRIRRVTIRIRTLLVLVALIAVACGAYVELARREARRREWPYEILDAADVGDVPRIRRLLDQGADVDSVTDGRFPWTPLMKAAWRGRTDAVRLLLERGADPDHEDLDCLRAVTLAASASHWDIVRLLVEHGADSTKSDVASKTALDYAKEKGPPEMALWLELRTPKPK
jgi:ankyrin repeat protein